jgi:hypothetical protein
MHVVSSWIWGLVAMVKWNLSISVTDGNRSPAIQSDTFQSQVWVSS